MNLPWSNTATSQDPAVIRDGHRRATQLAVNAMKQAETMPITGMSDYARAQADYERRAAELRASNVNQHVAANNARAEQARLAKAERQAAHARRNEEARQAKIARKMAKAA